MDEMISLTGWPAVATILGVATILALVAFIIIRLILKNKANFYINKNGIVVKAQVKDRITPRMYVESVVEILSYVEGAKEQYVDDVIGIKNRFFKQSKDYAASVIDTIQNQIVEQYKDAYMKKYSGLHKTQEGEYTRQPILSEDLEEINPTVTQLTEAKEKKSNPCAPWCLNGCNSGLYYFNSRITKDFQPLKQQVFSLIEENHLINRNDREYEEEILSLAENLTSELKNKAISYPIPIDNSITHAILDRMSPILEKGIADALRRSRTLSIEKRAKIDEEKIAYVKHRNEQLSRIITILGSDDLQSILKSVNTFDLTENNLPDNSIYK